MRTGILAVCINLVFNYLLIFGKFGFPELGVQGAAVATVLSRFVEFFAIYFWTKRHSGKYTFAEKIFSGWHIPKSLTADVMKKGMPLLVNEFLWSSAKAVISQCISTRGLAAVGALNIANTVYNVFNVVFIALGSSVAIVVGKLLGAGKMKEARDTDTKMIVFSVVSCAGISALMALIAPFFPKIYNTTAEVQSIATVFILIIALMMPVHAFNHAAYFTLRSGGKTFITFLFDCVFSWVIVVPVVAVLAHCTTLPIMWLYMVGQGLEIIKCIIGLILVKKGVWLSNIVSDNK